MSNSRVRLQGINRFFDILALMVRGSKNPVLGDKIFFEVLIGTKCLILLHSDFLLGAKVNLLVIFSGLAAEKQYIQSLFL